MLNILKKKLANEYFCRWHVKLKISFIFIYFLIGLSFASTIQQGEFIDTSLVSKIYVGMNKSEVIKIFGEPVLKSLYNCDCICYYFYLYPSNCYASVTKQYLILFFENSFLKEFFFRL